MNTFKDNRVCRKLNITYPIIEGGMAWAGTAALAAAVSNEGGLGTIGAGSMNAYQLRMAIYDIRKLTSKPFAVNLILISPFIDELIDVVIAEEVPVCIFGAGNPADYIDRLKKNGITVCGVCSSPNLAILFERAGVELIIAEGLEAGGHIGDVTTMTLLPAVAESVSVPLIAAGGISSGSGMLAAFSLGAEGIQMGTRFLCSHEAEISDTYKALLLKKDVRGTEVTGETLGHPVRVIKTKFSRKLKKTEKSDPKRAEEMMLGSLQNAVRVGEADNSAFMSGMSAGNIHSILSVHEIFTTTLEEYERQLKTLSGKTGQKITSLFRINEKIRCTMKNFNNTIRINGKRRKNGRY